MSLFKDEKRIKMKDLFLLEKINFKMIPRVQFGSNIGTEHNLKPEILCS